jgi:hypothetical protein
MLDGREFRLLLPVESMLVLDEIVVGDMIIGVKFLLARRLALYIASSAASRITLLRRRPEGTTCSSLIDCFLRSLSGKFNNHETSAEETDSCRVGFRKRTFWGLFVDCREGLTARGCLKPRRSARDSLLRAVTPGSLVGMEPEFSANLNLSRVEKYCREKALA